MLLTFTLGEVRGEKKKSQSDKTVMFLSQMFLITTDCIISFIVWKEKKKK